MAWRAPIGWGGSEVVDSEWASEGRASLVEEVRGAWPF